MRFVQEVATHLSERGISLFARAYGMDINSISDIPDGVSIEYAVLDEKARQISVQFAHIGDSTFELRRRGKTQKHPRFASEKSKSLFSRRLKRLGTPDGTRTRDLFREREAS